MTPDLREANLDFAAFFNEKVKARGLTLKKLADTTGIALQHLENLSGANYAALPPAPYLRGYMKILGRTLDFDPQVWLEYFAEIRALRSSGGSDALPRNRFALQPIKKHGLAAIVTLALLLYFGFRFSAIFGQPSITLAYPAEAIVSSAVRNVTLAGETRHATDLFVNGESVPLEENRFVKEVELQPGLNSFEIKAKKFLGGETTILRQIIYEPAPLPPSALVEEEEATSTDNNQ